MKQFSKKDKALKETTLKTYKVHIRPCSPFEGFDGKGETIELTTDRLGWSMQEYQRNRVPLIWDVVSIKDPK